MKKKSLSFLSLLLLISCGLSVNFNAAHATATVEYLVVGGGGAGGVAGVGNGNNFSGGGGAGGFKNGTNYVVTTQAYTITVGAGGASNTNGSNSVFDTITSTGGGRGGSQFFSANNGGSGGGSYVGGAVGTGTVGQGNNGGLGSSSSQYGTGGGGGASAVGQNGSTTNGGNGGAGTDSSISGSSVTYAGGGGGSINSGTAGTGGLGGGGAGNDAGTGTAGTANSGGGGGGSKGDSQPGGAGGSGIVIIRYITGSLTATGGTITTSGSYTIHTFTTSGTFTVTGITLFNFSSFITENIGDAVSLFGNITIGSADILNITSIVHSVNGSVVNTNSTGQNGTSNPNVINFGPFYYQQTTDDAYNHTITVTVQDSSYSVLSNTTYDVIVREYDPDYFLAIDPTQGLVNYTFPEGNDVMNVNRDTNGALFDIECQYFTQSDAFFNNLDEGTWDNRSNVLFYVGDASGFYYVRCFNDGELFVTSISQNFSNALVPGLAIFDQLGGFFGAPSIILVILSILSLGTGRNYPIILLIAASVTGILLALELLTLDPGLVVVLIVQAGIGLFGIRKFY